MEFGGYNYELNIEAILRDEEADPEFSFFAMMERMGTRVRLTDVIRLCEYVSSSYEEMFKERGVTFGDLPQIVEGCIEEAGFRSAEHGQA